MLDPTFSSVADSPQISFLSCCLSWCNFTRVLSHILWRLLFSGHQNSWEVMVMLKPTDKGYSQPTRTSTVHSSTASDPLWSRSSVTDETWDLISSHHIWSWAWIPPAAVKAVCRMRLLQNWLVLFISSLFNLILLRLRYKYVHVVFKNPLQASKNYIWAQLNALLNCNYI